MKVRFLAELKRCTLRYKAAKEAYNQFIDETKKNKMRSLSQKWKDKECRLRMDLGKAEYEIINICVENLGEDHE